MCVRKTSGTSTNHSYRHHPSSPPHSKRRPGAIEGFARAIPIMEEEKQPPPPPQQQQSKSSDAQTGLEESLWQMGLGGAEAGGSLPERPGEPDCVYFLRTGSCGFGDRCRFHHPRDRTVGTDLPERAGQPLCQYFMRTGTCKFGATCKYHHPNHGGSLHQVQLNYHGYPLRPGEKECAYYVKTGNCKFGATCKFHHPQPAGTMAAATAAFPGPTFYPPTVQTPSAPPSQPYSPAGSWPLARPSLYMPGSYAYGPMPVPPGVLSVPGWTPYQPHHVNPVVSSGAFQTVQAGAMYGGAPYQHSASTPAYTGLYPPAPSPSGHSSNSQKEHSFPERPGQPECQFYLRTGDCKYGASCRYHHPPEWSMPRTNCALSPLGLPIRPGAPPCTFYTQNGVCKFGPTCKFDHPVASLSYSPSASSLADIPVAPYPIGYSVAALAPSLSSSDLRHEYFGGISGDSFSVRAAHSGNRPSGLVGSMFSSGYPVSQSGRASAQQSTVQSDTRSSSSHGVVITSSS